MSIVHSKKDSVRAYLEEIGRKPLLTPEQEVVYSKAVQAQVRLEELKAQLAEKLGYEPALEQWAEAASLTIDELRTGLNAGHRAKQKMVEANLRLVVSIAKKYIKSDVEFLDLIQEGSVGLQRGVEKFDPAKGYRFSTYAYWWIRQGITRAIAEKSRMVRLPIHIHEKLNKIKTVQRRLTQTLGRSATHEEVAEALNLSPQKVRDFLKYSRQPISLDLRLGDNQGTELGELLEDDAPSPEDYVTLTTLRADLAEMMTHLTPQQREVVSLRFGLKGDKGLTLAKIGDRLNVSRERVRQVEREALKQLRQQRHRVHEYLTAV